MMWRSLIVAGTLAISAPATAQELSGRASVTDGDTLELMGERVRLHGIDAPEGRQTCTRGGVEWLCGQEAAARLRALVRGAEVTCAPLDRDRYGRIVARCAANGTDLGAQLVSEGLALAYRRYSEAYVDAEASAKAASFGMWQGQFVAPWDWRQGKRLQPAAAANDNRDCHIKGNIARDGERIYHVPEGRYYDRTKISTAKGERWFCSEDDARAAGWRRSKR